MRFHDGDHVRVVEPHLPLVCVIERNWAGGLMRAEIEVGARGVVMSTKLGEAYAEYTLVQFPARLLFVKTDHLGLAPVIDVIAGLDAG